MTGVADEHDFIPGCEALEPRSCKGGELAPVTFRDLSYCCLDVGIEGLCWVKWLVQPYDDGGPWMTG